MRSSTYLLAMCLTAMLCTCSLCLRAQEAGQTGHGERRAEPADDTLTGRSICIVMGRIASVTERESDERFHMRECAIEVLETIKGPKSSTIVADRKTSESRYSLRQGQREIFSERFGKAQLASFSFSISKEHTPC